MKNEFVTLSREPVAWIDPICLERMGRQPERTFVVTGRHRPTYDVPLYTALAEPVPPAGGEPLPQRMKDHHQDDYSYVRFKEGHNAAFDAFEPIVTRLQAEVEHWRERSARWKERVAELTNEGNALQSELTKERELSETLKNFLRSEGYGDFEWRGGTQQSAPAAKAETVAFPGYPPVPEDRKIPADAGGYGDDAPCPECGHPDCNGQCYGDDMMGDS